MRFFQDASELAAEAPRVTFYVTFLKGCGRESKAVCQEMDKFGFLKLILALLILLREEEFKEYNDCIRGEWGEMLSKCSQPTAKCFTSRVKMGILGSFSSRFGSYS